MAGRLQSRIVAALVAPALVASGAAQGLLLMRCGQEVRVAASCCCKHEQPASPTVAPAPARCCASVAVPASQAQVAADRAITSAPAPVLVALAVEPVFAASALAPRGSPPRVEPPPSRSPVLSNCALLI